MKPHLARLCVLTTRRETVSETHLVERDTFAEPGGVAESLNSFGVVAALNAAAGGCTTACHG